MKFLTGLVLIVLLSCNTKSDSAEVFPASIYLSEVDSLQVQKDIQYLETLPYVASAKFLSKEENKKKYLGDENENWDEVLSENPLPNSYALDIYRDKFSQDDIVPVIQLMEKNIPNCMEVAIPLALVPR